MATSASSAAAPRLYVVYVTEPRLSRFLVPPQLGGACLLAEARAQKASISVRRDSTSSVDETGNRFNCKNAYWYDLTCQGNNPPSSRAPAAQKIDSATILLDVSQSMRNYDPPKNGSCHRAELLRALRDTHLSARVFGHAESLQQLMKLDGSNEELARQACQSNGDNKTTHVFEQALPLHGDSSRPLVMVTDMSEQNAQLSAFLRAHGGREFFVGPDELVAKVLSLVR